MKHWLVLLLVPVFVVGLIGCGAASAPEVEAPPVETETYTDENGFFTAEYPADWVVEPYNFDDTPMPHVTFGSNQEILDLSSEWQPLPEGQIGMTVMLLPGAMFAEMGVAPETPLEEIVPIFMMDMATDPELEGVADNATFETITLDNGRSAVRATAAVDTEAYVIHFVDMGEGMYLFSPRILAVGYENADLEAQVEAIVNSVEVTASSEEVLGFMMENMGEMEMEEAALATYTDENGFFTAQYPADWVVEPYGFENDPSPHVTFGSNQEILDLSQANEPLPEGQIGGGVLLLPQAMLAEAGVTAETPLEDVIRMMVAATAPTDEVRAAMADAPVETFTLDDGTPAVRMEGAVETEAYVLRLADVGDGVYLFSPQILALDYENAELEAQIEDIFNSVEVTASGEEVLGFMMENMGEMEGAE